MAFSVAGRSHLVEWRSQFLGVPSYWAFPVTGRSHGLAAAAPGHGQVALGAKKVALGLGPWRARRGLFVKLWFYTAGHACGHPWAMRWCIFCALGVYLLDKIIYVSYNALVGILSAWSRTINAFVAASFDKHVRP